MALGCVVKAPMGFGLSGEYGIDASPEVGFVGMYFRYSENLNFIFYSGKWSYTNNYVLCMITCYYDLFRMKLLNNYGAFNID